MPETDTAPPSLLSVMTIRQAIDLADKLRPNPFDTSLKVGWLSKLDGMIFREVIQTHEGGEEAVFTPYADECVERQLLVPEPYAEDLYLCFLQMQIDKENAEYKRYNQSVTMYNNAYKTFQDWYNRTHAPLPRRTRFKI